METNAKFRRFEDTEKDRMIFHRPPPLLFKAIEGNEHLFVIAAIFAGSLVGYLVGLFLRG